MTLAVDMTPFRTAVVGGRAEASQATEPSGATGPRAEQGARLMDERGITRRSIVGIALLWGLLATPFRVRGVALFYGWVIPFGLIALACERFVRWRRPREEIYNPFAIERRGK